MNDWYLFLIAFLVTLLVSGCTTPSTQESTPGTPAAPAEPPTIQTGPQATAAAINISNDLENIDAQLNDIDAILDE